MTRDANGFISDVLENPLEVRTRTASATIQNSLFQAAADAQLPDRVAFELAEIFQYDIDFVLDIQSGDRFTVDLRRGVPGRSTAARRQHSRREIRQRRPRVSRRPLRRCVRTRPVLLAGRQEPAQGVHPRAGAVLAHQLAVQSLAPSSGPQSRFARTKASTTPRQWARRCAPPAKGECGSQANRADTATSSNSSTAPAS